MKRRMGESVALLDEWREPLHGLRVEVVSWHSLCNVEDQFIERPRSFRLIWQYLRRIGPVATWRKVLSRMRESVRNRKVAAVGTGVVLEAPAQSLWRPSDGVVFFAPNHSTGRPRVCIDERFVLPISEWRTEEDHTGEVIEIPPELAPYVGWSVFSGIEIDREQVAKGLRQLSGHTAGLGYPPNPVVRGNAPVVERSEGGRHKTKPSAVLFGLGNYAKTQIIPYIRRHLELSCVHEIDPDQLTAARDWRVTLDTSPVPREWERYDVWFVAGFHHSHSALAVHALRQGAYAVVEKPLATNWKDYEALRLTAESLIESRLFAGFHKRYSRLTRWAAADLAVETAQPVDMHCIVYEIPLPRLHWYNWPTSGSRLISNGCHWLDYFLFMNDYDPVTEAHVHQGRGSDLAVFVRLENGAMLNMSLTDTGSARLGVRDVIELRSADVTVRMVDGAFYKAENASRVLRNARVNPMEAYRRMYSSVSQRIIQRQPGDPPKTLRSTELVLQLEDHLGTSRRRISGLRGCSS